MNVTWNHILLTENTDKTRAQLDFNFTSYRKDNQEIS